MYHRDTVIWGILQRLSRSRCPQPPDSDRLPCGPWVLSWLWLFDSQFFVVASLLLATFNQPPSCTTAIPGDTQGHPFAHRISTATPCAARRLASLNACIARFKSVQLSATQSLIPQVRISLRPQFFSSCRSRLTLA